VIAVAIVTDELDAMRGLPYPSPVCLCAAARVVTIAPGLGFQVNFGCSICDRFF